MKRSVDIIKIVNELTVTQIESKHIIKFSSFYRKSSKSKELIHQMNYYMAELVFDLIWVFIST